MHRPPRYRSVAVALRAAASLTYAAARFVSELAILLTVIDRLHR